MKTLTPMLTTICALLAFGCAPADEKNPADDSLSCDASLDSDGDGIDDCSELDLGLDPASDDTDGDGMADGAEIDCGSSPTDIDDTCYQCGWGRNDPGNITPTGAALGDVMENLSLVDQCKETIDTYDFAGEYHILYMTAAF